MYSYSIVLIITISSAKEISIAPIIYEYEDNRICYYAFRIAAVECVQCTVVRLLFPVIHRMLPMKKGLNKATLVIHQQQCFDVVIMATEEDSSTLIQRKMVIFSSMIELLTKHYNCYFILFSNSSSISDYFKRAKHITVTSYDKNEYGLPIIAKMFIRAKELVNGEYYGYLNSDILLHPSLFSILSYLRNLSHNELLPKDHEIAGRAYIAGIDQFPSSFSTIAGMEDFFMREMRNNLTLRGQYSSVRTTRDK